MTPSQKYSLQEIEHVVRLVIQPLTAQVEGVQNSIKIMSDILTGNGDPETGLVYKAKLADDRIKIILKERADEKLTLAQKKTALELRWWQVILILLGQIVSVAFAWIIGSQ